MNAAENRLALAERLVELAEHSSEAEMRASVSRLYYAVYHVAIMIVGNMAHGEIPYALNRVENELGAQYKDLLELRHQADYDPEFVTRQFGSLVNFRIQFPREMEKARALYERLRSMVKDS